MSLFELWMYVIGESLDKNFHSLELWVNLFLLTNVLISSQDVRYRKGSAKFSQPWGIFYLFSAASWDVYKALLKLVRWVLFCPLLISMSEAFSVTFTLNKIYTKLWVTETVFGPGVKSPSETTNPAALFTIYRWAIIWVLVQDLQDKVRTLGALVFLFS